MRALKASGQLSQPDLPSEASHKFIFRRSPRVAAETEKPESLTAVRRSFTRHSKPSSKLCARKALRVALEKCVHPRSPCAASIPMKNSRLRLWATPKYCESHSSTSTIYPISASASRIKWTSSPPEEDKSPGTFSRSMLFGRRSFAMRTISQKRPDRSPPSPARLPATERSWQGKPPTSRSIRPRSS